MLVTHQHPFVLLHRFVGSVLLFLLPFALQAIFATGWAVTVGLVVGMGWGVINLVLALYSWNCTLFVLTTERIIFLEQHGFFQRELVESALTTIQQVSHHVHGILPTIFTYGNLVINAGNAPQPIIIRNIPDPYDIQQEILEAQTGEGFMEAE